MPDREIKNNGEKPSPSAWSRDADRTDFPIVAIGASAGGLEALEVFFNNMPPDSGMAFVVITHLDPHRKTLMPELLAKYTAMSVLVAEEGMPVEPNSIYMIPVNAYMSIHERKLHLEEPLLPRGHRLPVDHFFQSLADDQAENGFCVILSGTGTDGTLGIKAVKEAGGMTVAQDLESARYSGMPYSAIETGVVDVVLPVEEIPEKLIEFTKMPSSSRGEQHAGIAERLREICKVLHTVTGTDFTSYKTNTLIRRIERRMIVTKCENAGDYVNLLCRDAEEAKALFRDLLIGVTSFFRDPDAFDLLRDKVIPELMKNRDKGEPVRIWTAGCSTGEETYSIAILMREAMERLSSPGPVQIFGTDMDFHAITRARAGLYSPSIEGELPRNYLEKYFHKENGAYRVAREIREMVVFAPHNLLRDPPFSQIDLIVCRNLLIYLEPKVQAQLIPMFYHSLRTKGFLFLGPSETVGGHRDLFEPVDKRWKIFHWKPSDARFPRDLHLGFDQGEVQKSIQQGTLKPDRPSPASLGQAALMSRYLPPSVIINSRQEIVHTYSRLSPFLEHPVGESTLNILRMAGKELRPVLRAAIHQAFSEGKPCIYERVRVEIDGAPRFVNVVVEPIRNPPSAQNLAVVSFEPSPGEAPGRGEVSSTESELVRHLEEQLRITTEQLHANLEESDRGEEELKSSNEELMSMNEELQSANEELETSKEELQALNEELVTVNSELQSKLEELSQANNDMQNLMLSSQVATVFLDKQLRIKRYTPQVAEVFNLIEGDIGRPIRHISSNIDYPELEEDARRVVRELKPIEREVRIPHQGDYLLRVLPYRTMEDVIEGVVLTFLDITRRKSAESERSRLADIVESSQDAIIRKELDGTIASWNQGAEEIYGYSAEEMVGKNIDIIVPPEKKEEMREIFHKLASGIRVAAFETVRLRKNGEPIPISLTVSPIRDERGKVVAASAIGRDIAERKERERALAEARDAAETANRTKSEFLANMSHEIRTPITVIQGALDLLLDAGMNGPSLNMVEMALSASGTLLRLIDDILDFSKMEAGVLEVVEEPFELRPCVEKAVRGFQPRIEEKGLTLTVEISERVPELVISDPVRFQQVLNNLVGNAVKFTEEGEIRVRVEPKEEAASGRGILEVSVTDTGIGIPEDKREAMFENFVQADSSHSRRFGGAGLGLAISKGLVERMGGTIALESAEGKGSSFRVRLPMVDKSSKPKVEKEATDAPKGVSSEEPVRILLAEDDPMISDVLAIILRREGWELVAVENGKECVEHFEKERFDVILMDIQMPRMNGYEAARAIRQKENGRNVPIVALTAHALDEAREESRKNGMNGYLTKPVDRAQLIATVRSMLKGG